MNLQLFRKAIRLMGLWCSDLAGILIVRRSPYPLSDDRHTHRSAAVSSVVDGRRTISKSL
ncbi:MAG: hypothetical protein HXL35_07940 [Prevotellaceae bacterium]|nr:hypothetical protein [Prevotellaceae bacterium]